MFGSVTEALAFCSCSSFPGETIFLSFTLSFCPAFFRARVTVGPQPDPQEVSKAEAGQDPCRDQPHSASGSILLTDTLKGRAIAQQLIYSCSFHALRRRIPGQEMSPVHPWAWQPAPSFMQCLQELFNRVNNRSIHQFFKLVKSLCRHF